jgi:hypothetical protein
MLTQQEGRARVVRAQARQLPSTSGEEVQTLHDPSVDSARNHSSAASDRGGQSRAARPPRRGTELTLLPT